MKTLDDPLNPASVEARAFKRRMDRSDRLVTVSSFIVAILLTGVFTISDDFLKDGPSQDLFISTMLDIGALAAAIFAHIVCEHALTTIRRRNRLRKAVYNMVNEDLAAERATSAYRSGIGRRLTSQIEYKETLVLEVGVHAKLSVLLLYASTYLLLTALFWMSLRVVCEFPLFSKVEHCNLKTSIPIGIMSYAAAIFRLVLNALEILSRWCPCCRAMSPKALLEHHRRRHGVKDPLLSSAV